MKKKTIYHYETEDYRVIKTDETRKRKRFIYFPIFHNKKVYWLQNVEVTERKYIEQIAEFDDGWSYMMVWQEPYVEWELEEIKKIKK